MIEANTTKRYGLRVLLALFAGVTLYIASYGPAWSVVIRVSGSSERWLGIYKPLPAEMRAEILRIWGKVDPKVDRLLKAHCGGEI